MKSLLHICLLTVAMTAVIAVSSCSRNRLGFPAAATVPQSPRDQLDSLFTTIADGNDAERGQAMETLNKRLHTGDPELRAIATDYTREVKGPAFKAGVSPERCALLLRVIPRLIAALDGREGAAAYGILTFIQPWSAPADRVMWEKWWKEVGRAQFAGHAKHLEA